MQVFVNGEFIGGSDILMGMHQSGDLKGVLEGGNNAAEGQS
jgi:monothiol glutaredoxin